MQQTTLDYYNQQNGWIHTVAKILQDRYGDFTMKEVHMKTGVPMNTLCYRFCDLKRKGVIKPVLHKGVHVKRKSYCDLRVNIDSKAWQIAS